MTFRATVSGGAVHFAARAAFDQYAATLEGKPVVLTMKVAQPSRTLRQNDWYS